MSYLKVPRFQDHENELQGTPDGQSAVFQAAANRYGKRGFLFFEPILALLILGLMMFCENIPQDWCNFPVEVTEENKEQLYEIGIKMMSMLKLTGVAVCLYAGISGNLSPAPMWPVWILIGGCFGIVIWGIRAMKKAGKDQ